MYYQQDWEKIKERFKAWWNQEILDRVLIQVIAPREGCNMSWWTKYGNSFGEYPIYRIIKNWADKGYDHEYLLEKTENQIASTYYGGDAVPFFLVNLGPGSLASYLGCRANFTDDTVWFGPPIWNDWESSPGIKLNPQSKLWRITKELTDFASKRGKDKFLISFADLGGVMDIIASLRGTEKLCLDLIESPDKVKELRDYIVKVWIKCYDELFHIIHKNQEGTLGWLPAWSPGKTYPLQCDFSAMISPKMYEEFVAPEIQTIARHLDNVVYHLDGPDAVKHLDIILDIPEIDAIQWVPGPKTLPGPDFLLASPLSGPYQVLEPKALSEELSSPSLIYWNWNWIPMLRRIQKKEKSLYVYASGPKEVELLISELSPEGLLICTSCNSEEEARRLVKKVEEWTTRRVRR